MVKKILSAALVLAIVGTSGTVVYSAKGNYNYSDSYISFISRNKENKALKLLKPEDETVTFDKTILLTGEASEGSKVIINVYSSTNIADNDFDFDNLPEDDDFTLTYEEGVEVGILESFAELVDLKLGINKIEVFLENSDDVKTRYVYVKDISEATEKANNINYSDTIKEVINSRELENNSQNEENTENPLEDTVDNDDSHQ
ncbi:hypothetical protein [Dethiothermospora halolimnae]|uniref:hypothetical protein n=1 Tax=Dethiothermospora halolimnae TaxID=3114390 RepID=UPI003CCBE232